MGGEEGLRRGVRVGNGAGELAMRGRHRRGGGGGGALRLRRRMLGKREGADGGQPQRSVGEDHAELGLGGGSDGGGERLGPLVLGVQLRL